MVKCFLWPPQLSPHGSRVERFSRQKQMVEKAARASRRRVEGPFSRSNLYSVIKSSLSCKKKSTEGYLSLFQTGLLRHSLPGEKHVNLQLVQKATDLETSELFPSAQSDFFFQGPVLVWCNLMFHVLNRCYVTTFFQVVTVGVNVLRHPPPPLPFVQLE